jgi:hypothetical protein
MYVIICPICRKQYKLTPKDPSTFAQKTFSCPNCHYSTPISTLIKEPSIPQSNASVEGGETKIVQSDHSATKVAQIVGMDLKAYITVLGSNIRFIIKQGMYILGRKSSDSPATLQLAPDISMSRQHARLSVQVVNGKLMAQIVCLKPNNPIFINGKVFSAGQRYTLKSGDKLQLGKTIIVYSN